jgi:hypothetical protein
MEAVIRTTPEKLSDILKETKISDRFYPKEKQVT